MRRPDSASLSRRSETSRRHACITHIPYLTQRNELFDLADGMARNVGKTRKEGKMKSSEQVPGTLEDIKVNVKLKLAALWAAVMFTYIYVDILGFYEPGSIESILEGKVWEFDITQAWALGALILMTLPSLMVFLSLALPAKVNRWTNIIMGALYILISVGNPIGESWAYIWVGSIVEIALLLLIVWYAWKWPRQETGPLNS